MSPLNTRPLDEVYDTPIEVARNPQGAHDAIQRLAAQVEGKSKPDDAFTVETLRAELIRTEVELDRLYTARDEAKAGREAEDMLLAATAYFQGLHAERKGCIVRDPRVILHQAYCAIQGDQS